ncbi:CoA-binding protein [Pontibacter sp. G13]|uniref:CoA-binding protein n=1 Tax=Pontibacter sp. G13 TaxID=3074898 RepID=UPI002889AF22|nr:CoA-binding protein [Pontibacter sp. G13]WNJ16370.1 CoA-binding protein [Pontibacter sp. G13]
MSNQTLPTLVLGATTNPGRYAYLAVHSLMEYGHEVIPVGIKTGEVNGIPIHPVDLDWFPKVDTVTLYVGPARQPQYYDWLVNLKPRRVIFNPGTENPELMRMLDKHQIESVVACTLVMLSTRQYA